MFTIQTRFIWVWLLLFASFLISCSPGSTPPGASSIGGVVDGGSYSYHYWEEGLAILLWQDTSYGSGESCSGTASTEDPVYRLECNVSGPEGRNYSWKVHTADGVTAEMWIEGQPIDLSKGAMFLVNIGQDGVQVGQLQRDLSDLEPSNDAISALAESDPDVANFIAGIETESDSLDVNDKFDLAELADALRMTGQSVETGGSVDQPFFSVPGQVIVVNGEEVQVFEFADSAAAATEVAQISPDASSVGISMMTWVAKPHFYALDRVIVLYVGDNQAVANALNQVLGHPLARGQEVSLLPPDTVTLLSDAYAVADYETLQELMGETFTVGYWLSDGQTLSPAQAVDQLRLFLLPDPASVSFVRDRALFPDLGNMDPATAFGPDVQIVDLVLSQGRGTDGRGEAILTIAQGADGSHDTFAQPIYIADVSSYHRGRMCVIGDARAVARPFTAGDVFKGMNNALDMAEALATQSDIDEALAEWSATETATGRRLTSLGIQLEKALIWNILDFASIDEAGMRDWWENAAKMPEDMFASGEASGEDKA